jgi:ATP-dependent Clp protease ATP-binding subunit ClpA
MIKSVQNRLKEKGINLIVDLSVQAFLTDEGYDPIYGARPLRRAIMKYLEDTLLNNVYQKLYIQIQKFMFVEKKLKEH